MSEGRFMRAAQGIFVSRGGHSRCMGDNRCVSDGAEEGPTSVALCLRRCGVSDSFSIVSELSIVGSNCNNDIENECNRASSWTLLYVPRTADHIS